MNGESVHPATAKAKAIMLLKLFLNHEKLRNLGDQEWEMLYEHVNTHRFFMESSGGSQIQWADALFSWYEQVYKPLRDTASSGILRRAFPGDSKEKLIFTLSSHWYYLKQRRPHAAALYAGLNYAARFGRKPVRYLAAIAQHFAHSGAGGRTIPDNVITGAGSAA